MRKKKRFNNASIPIFFLAFLLLTGCSKGSNPTTPGGESVVVNYHKLVGVYTATFDFEKLTCETQKNEELIDKKFFTIWLPVPAVKVNSYYNETGVVDFDMEITNPSRVDAYDPRVVVYADNEGRYLQNFDGWTRLFIHKGGWLANPYIAFAKDDPERKFVKKTTYTANFQMYLPPGTNTMNFSIDINYPRHCAEPYEVCDYTQDVINPQIKSSTFIEINARDWDDDITDIYLRCPEVTGYQYVSFSQVIGDTWGLTLINRQGAPAGKYLAMLFAKSKNSGLVFAATVVTVAISRDTVPPKWVSVAGITDVSAGNGQVTVFWNMAVDPPNPPPIYYLLYMDTDDSPWDQTPVVRFWHNPYTFTGLENGKTYYFGIRTMDSAGPPNIDTNNIVLSAVPHAG